MGYGLSKANGAYTSGSRYKKFFLSNSERMNAQVKNAQRSQLQAAAGIIFSQQVAEAQGLAELAIKQAMQRGQAALVNLKI